MEKNKGQQLKKFSTCTELSTDWIFDRSIVSIKKLENGDLAIALLLGDMQDGLNIDKPMTASQLKECAAEIIREYPHFKLNDLQVFCHGCKFGRYGKAYNRLNGQILFEWLVVFDQERTAKICEDRKREQEQRAGKLDQSDAVDWDDMAKVYARAKEEQEQKNEKRKQRELKWKQHREQNKDEILKHQQERYERELKNKAK